jgi:hypothetical protein
MKIFFVIISLFVSATAFSANPKDFLLEVQSRAQNASWCVLNVANEFIFVENDPSEKGIATITCDGSAFQKVYNSKVSVPKTTQLALAIISQSGLSIKPCATSHFFEKNYYSTNKECKAYREN